MQSLALPAVYIQTHVLSVIVLPVHVLIININVTPTDSEPISALYCVT